MSHSNHKNIAKFKQALRDDKGDLYIIMELCDCNLYEQRMKDVGEEGFYEEAQIVNMLR